MDTMSIVSGILATQDETRQMQIATTVLNANAQKNAAQALLAEQASPANPGPGVGDNLDVTA
jgi:hypothetical protein